MCLFLKLIFILAAIAWISPKTSAQKCNFDENDRSSCPSSDNEHRRKSICEEKGCCWNASVGGVPSCFFPKNETSSSFTANQTVSVTVSICINCPSNTTDKDNSEVVDTSIEETKTILSGSQQVTDSLQKSQIALHISNAFENASSDEQETVMMRFLSVAEESYNSQSSSSVGINTWISFFDNILQQPTVEAGDIPQTFLNRSSTILINKLNAFDEANNTLSAQVVNKLESYALILTKSLLGDVSSSSTAVTATLDFENVVITSCFENVNASGCDLSNLNVSASVKSFGIRSYVTSISYKSTIRFDTTSLGKFQNAVVGSSLFSIVAHDGETGIANTSLMTTLKKLKNDDNGNVVCAFISSSNADWSDEGCNVVINNSTSASCSCNHNTSFALLFLHSDIQLSEAEKNYFEIITYIGSGTSITALMLTIFCFFYLRLTRIKRVLLHLNLSASLCIGQIILLIGTRVKVGTIHCKIVAISLHFFFMASFSWMLMEGVLLYFQSVRAVKGDVNFKLMLAFGWILPISIVGISLSAGYDGYGSDRGCWLSIHNGLTWAFIGPALGFILINTILLGMIVKVFLKLKSNAKSGEWERSKRGARAVLLLTPLLGITWIFGALAVNEATKWFLYLFSICNSLQGLAIFFFHCLHNHDVRKAFLKKYRRSFQNIPPFFSSVNPSTTGKTFVKTASASASVSIPNMAGKPWN